MCLTGSDMFRHDWTCPTRKDSLQMTSLEAIVGDKLHSSRHLRTVNTCWDVVTTRHWLLTNVLRRETKQGITFRMFSHRSNMVLAVESIVPKETIKIPSSWCVIGNVPKFTPNKWERSMLH